jgi:integration host factor subunit beta
LTEEDVEMAVNTILDNMINGLVSGERVEIRGFGSLSLHFRPPRVGRNPKTGEQVKVPAKYVPHFKPGNELKNRADYV